MITFAADEYGIYTDVCLAYIEVTILKIQDKREHIPAFPFAFFSSLNIRLFYIDPATVGTPRSKSRLGSCTSSPVSPLEPVSAEELPPPAVLPLLPELLLPPPNSLVIKVAKSSSDLTFAKSESVAPKPLRYSLVSSSRT